MAELAAYARSKGVSLQLYEDILSDANRYGLQVIFHGCTLPRGWERMYPNFVASEAFDLTIHPFCRNAAASMDLGGLILCR